MAEYKLSYTAAQIDGKLKKIDTLAAKSEIPTATSDLTNDSGFATETYVQEKLDAKMDKNNPVGTGSFSMNRKSNTVIGNYSHAEGYDTTASGNYSHAEGYDTTASGLYSHAEGYDTTASGLYSHAEGIIAIASGGSSHAEGANTKASGNISHAEGASTIASGGSSHAEGTGTTASGGSSHVQGRYNIEDTAVTDRAGLKKYAHIVGNGTTYTSRSNAHTLDWNGVGWFQGGLQVGGTAQDDGAQTVMLNGDKEIILASSTEGSTKKFKLTIDDDGVLTVSEIEITT